MAMNRVQFQQGLSMTQLMAQYGTEAKCRRALFRSRWPKGVSLSGVRRPVVFAIPARGAVVLPVSGVPASNDAAERHGV